MGSLLIVIIKLVVMLGFLIIIHEGGHFLVAKICNVKVNEFSIGFGKEVYSKQGKETKYSIRLIPLGGYVSMEGENDESEHERAFSKASIPKRIAIVLAGPIVNIVFGLAIYIMLFGFQEAINYIMALGQGLKDLFTAKIGMESMVGPIGIGNIISHTNGFLEFITLVSIISVSLGITNLLPVPVLDGGRLLILIVEAIRRKPMKQDTEVVIQFVGFMFLVILSGFVMYQDLGRIFLN